ncbi:hypothetical protein [uncultured Nostoc sp.]|uniref:hypothetical protein n=1 Tax=uncultured Nostoc sp. TaxID=340711 RepID=UPI0035CAB232
MEPQPLKFDDFVARCPEKLELIDGYIGQSKQDAKQLLAMSLQSFGLVETVKLAQRRIVVGGYQAFLMVILKMWEIKNQSPIMLF